MKVIVTRDSWGFRIWRSGTELTYMKKPFGSITSNSESIWLETHYHLFSKNLLLDKNDADAVCQDIALKVKIGEMKEAELSATLQ